MPTSPVSAFAVIQQGVAALGMKARGFGDAAGEIAEAAGDQHGVGAMGPHGGEQDFGAGIEPHPLGIGAFQRVQLAGP